LAARFAQGAAGELIRSATRAPIMVTIFHVLPVFGLVFGLVFGTYVGVVLLGAPGAIGGAIGGGALGFVGGRLAFPLAVWSVARTLARKTVAELRADLRDPACPTPNCVLLELQYRGKDIRQELPVVLEMLVSEDLNRRSGGWAALVSAFPELSGAISDYSAFDSVEECRRKTNRLRTLTEPDPAA
jgi:hypothetical protein